jgi:hypothetical protein
MGCLKLTYDYEEQPLFLSESGEKNYTLKWQVWTNPESDFLEVGEVVQTGGVTQKFSLTTVGWAPFDYEQGKYSAQAVASYGMDGSISVYSEYVYDNEGRIQDVKYKATVRVVSFVSSSGGHVVPNAKFSVGTPGSGGFAETKTLSVVGPAIVRGGSQYTYVGVVHQKVW